MPGDIVVIQVWTQSAHSPCRSPGCRAQAPCVVLGTPLDRHRLALASEAGADDVLDVTSTGSRGDAVRIVLAHLEDLGTCARLFATGRLRPADVGGNYGVDDWVSAFEDMESGRNISRWSG